MTIDERLERLAGVVETLAASVVAHDDRLDDLDDRFKALFELTERNSVAIERNTKNIERLSREWQAYLTTIHPKQ